MIKISRFNELNTVLMSVLLKLVDSDNLCKLINYDTYTPLSETSMTDNTTLLFDKIYPYPFTPNVDEEARTVINVLLDNFELGKTNTYFKNNQLSFVVICHKDLWRIDSMLRPFAILNEIDTLFNCQNGYGVGKTIFDNGHLLWINAQYSGYKVTYNLCDFN